MNSFIDALATWKGRRFIQDALEARGLLVPKAYQTLLINYCGVERSVGIEDYWNEWAKEWVCSRGWGNPNLRVFKGDYAYRSPYLDALAEKFDYRSTPIKNPSIHPCVHEFEKHSRQSKLGAEISAKMEYIKSQEIEKCGIRIEVGKDVNHEIAASLKKYMELNGFYRSHNMFYKKVRSGLTFNCWLDKGHGVGLMVLPIRSSITYEPVTDCIFEISFLDIFVPGFSYYGTYKTSESAILGVFAHAALLDIIVSSFS